MNKTTSLTADATETEMKPLTLLTADMRTGIHTPSSSHLLFAAVKVDTEVSNSLKLVASQVWGIPGRDIHQGSRVGLEGVLGGEGRGGEGRRGEERGGEREALRARG